MYHRRFGGRPRARRAKHAARRDVGVQALSVRPPLPVRARPRDAHELAFRGLDRAAQLGVAQAVRAAAAAVTGHRDGRHLSQPRRAGCGSRQERRAPRGARHVRLRIPRGGDRDATAAAGQSANPACSAAARRTRSSTASASTTRASRHSSPTSRVARYRGILGINIGKNFDTPNERAADDYLACLRAVHAHAHYVAVNISSPNTRACATCRPRMRLPRCSPR